MKARKMARRARRGSPTGRQVAWAGALAFGLAAFAAPARAATFGPSPVVMLAAGAGAPDVTALTARAAALRAELDRNGLRVPWQGGRLGGDVVCAHG
jgi:hypothetical protein